MNRYLTLTKTFISAIRMSKPQDARRKVMITILSLFAIFGVMLPVCFGVGFFVKIMTDTFLSLTIASKGLEIIFHIICLFTAVFGINVIFNELYFSDDIEFLLPWPLRAYEIVASRFTAVFISENFMQFLLLLSCIVGFSISSPMGILRWIMALFGMILLPVIPLCYCAIISMLLMAFTRFLRNKDVIQRWTIALLLVLMLAFVGSIGLIQGMDLDVFITSLAEGNQPFSRVMNYIFPNVPLYARAFGDGDSVAFLFFMAVNAIAIAMMLGLSEILYYRGIIGLTSSPDKKHKTNLEALLSRTRAQSPYRAYIRKELLILTRTPVYFTNCVAVNFIWPIFVYAILRMQGQNPSIQGICEAYIHGDFTTQCVFLLGVVCIALLVTALNSLSSNAISREGKHFAFMKYIPVPYEVQWKAKVMVSCLISDAGILIFLLPAGMILRLPVLHMIIYVALTLLTVRFVSSLGIYLDSIQPKLIWDDELSALRENYNTFFNMAIAIFIAIVLGVGGYFLLKMIHPSMGSSTFYVGAAILTAIMAICNIITEMITINFGKRNLEEQEEA